MTNTAITFRPTDQEKQGMVPVMREPFSIRVATPDDHNFIEQMQRHFNNELGFSYRKIIETRLEQGLMSLAEDEDHVPMGFISGNYQYSSQEQLAIVFQLAVVELKHRKLVGACLLADFIKNAPWGTRLICCWCAQDLPANYFWEGMGFIPIAFRTGSRQRKRIHIFWQRRIRPEDTTTPLWYPKGTQGGQIAEGRLILPIPPGTHWKDDLPSLVPPEYASSVPLLANGMPDPSTVTQRRKVLPPADVTPEEAIISVKQHSKVFTSPTDGEIVVMVGGRMRKRKKPGYRQPEAAKKEVSKRRKVSKSHQDAARELRDKYLEALNRVDLVGSTKYDISRLPELATSKLAAFDTELLKSLTSSVVPITPLLQGASTDHIPTTE